MMLCKKKLKLGSILKKVSKLHHGVSGGSGSRKKVAPTDTSSPPGGSKGGGDDEKDKKGAIARANRKEKKSQGGSRGGQGASKNSTLRKDEISELCSSGKESGGDNIKFEKSLNNKKTKKASRSSRRRMKRSVSVLLLKILSSQSGAVGGTTTSGAGGGGGGGMKGQDSHHGNAGVGNVVPPHPYHRMDHRGGFGGGAASRIQPVSTKVAPTSPRRGGRSQNVRNSTTVAMDALEDVMVSTEDVDKKAKETDQETSGVVATTKEMCEYGVGGVYSSYHGDALKDLATACEELLGDGEDEEGEDELYYYDYGEYEEDEDDDVDLMYAQHFENSSPGEEDLVSFMSDPAVSPLLSSSPPPLPDYPLLAGARGGYLDGGNYSSAYGGGEVAAGRRFGLLSNDPLSNDPPPLPEYSWDESNIASAATSSSPLGFGGGGAFGAMMDDAVPPLHDDDVTAAMPRNFHPWGGDSKKSGGVRAMPSSPRVRRESASDEIQDRSSADMWFGDQGQGQVDVDENDLASVQGDGPVSAALQDQDEVAQQADEERRPIVYRYFGRSRRRTGKQHLPFIVLGPNVEHWKVAGQALASRGFSVMVCESSPKGGDEDGSAPYGEGRDTVVAVMEALRWKRAVVIGCDAGAADALDAAVQLGPDRVAGLILSGDMREAESYVSGLEETLEDHPNHDDDDHRRRRHMSYLSVDNYLKNEVPCPGTIVWDGDLYAIPSFKKGSKVSLADFKSDGFQRDARTVILGGGRCPHRRLPEQFVWVLTRFAETEVPPVKSSSSSSSYATDAVGLAVRKPVGVSRGGAGSVTSTLSTAKRGLLGQVSESEVFRKVFNAETMLVSGRLVATAIAYIAAANIMAYQYHNIRGGVSLIRAKYHWLASLQKQCFSMLFRVVADDWKKKRSFVRAAVCAPWLGMRRQKKKDRGLVAKGPDDGTDGTVRGDEFGEEELLPFMGSIDFEVA